MKPEEQITALRDEVLTEKHKVAARIDKLLYDPESGEAIEHREAWRNYWKLEAELDLLNWVLDLHFVGSQSIRQNT